MPYGCRIGICHTCTLTMASGRIKDLRNGEEHREPNEAVADLRHRRRAATCTLNI